MLLKKIIYIVTILILVINSVYSQELDPRIKNANDAYTKGDYQPAIDQYTQVVNEGNVAPELYFNLANAYYKNNQISLSILNYERALKLKPDDEDIKFNLQMANLKIVDKMDAIPQMFYQDWWENFKNIFSMDGWAWLAIISVFLTLTLFILFLIANVSAYKRIAFSLSIMFLIVSISSFVFAQKQYKSVHEAGQAVVTAPTIVVKGSPSETGTELFVIHEGLKVIITENVGDWYQIKLPNGNQGWLKVSSVEII